MVQNIEDQELTLMNSGGVFVKMRKPNIVDIWRSGQRSKGEHIITMIQVISDVCLFDDQKWTFEQVRDMDPFDFALLLREFGKRYGSKR